MQFLDVPLYEIIDNLWIYSALSRWLTMLQYLCILRITIPIIRVPLPKSFDQIICSKMDILLTYLDDKSIREFCFLFIIDQTIQKSRQIHKRNQIKNKLSFEYFSIQSLKF